MSKEMNDQVTVPIQTLIDIAAGVAWYDMVKVVEPSAALIKAAKNLESGEYADIDLAKVPEDVLARHIADRDAGGHGLKLQPTAGIVGVIRYADGGIGVLIGYQLAD